MKVEKIDIAHSSPHLKEIDKTDSKDKCTTSDLKKSSGCKRSSRYREDKDIVRSSEALFNVLPDEYKWHQYLRDQIGYYFFKTASLCTDPACKIDEIKTTLSIPDKHIFAKKSPTGFQKSLRKTALISQALLLGPLSLALSPFSMLFRLLGYGIQYSDFNYFKGNAEEKPFPTDSKISTFFLNTCFIGGGYPYTHGGVLPWTQRIEKISSNILENDPDVVCLSEVYDFKAALKLYDQLKDNYAHFYLNIGPHYFAAKSGIFVASKFKIKNPHFIDFHDTLIHNKGTNRRGAFAIDLLDQDNKTLSKIYANHFEYSLNDSKPSDDEILARSGEVDLLLSDLQKTTKGKEIDYPVLLTGDFNFKPEEFSKTALINHFSKTDTDIIGTCRRDEFIKALFDETKSIDDDESSSDAHDLDHTFIMSKSFDGKDLKRYDISTKLVKSFERKTPILEALSDHHGLITKISV
jgi:endonuclease/exonuclease/phosphatase family metal-dependent hydrolase